MSEQVITFRLSYPVDAIFPGDVRELAPALAAAMLLACLNQGSLPFIKGKNPGEIRRAYAAAVNVTLFESDQTPPLQIEAGEWFVCMDKTDSTIPQTISIRRKGES